jgi:hypothetical protein
MNGSYKCAQCGLVNWTIDDYCKRCGVPNPFLAQTAQGGGAQAFAPQNANNFAPPNANNFAPPNNAWTPPAPPVRTMPDYASPPPPNVFGAGVGTTSVEGFGGYQNRPPVRDFNQQAQSPEFEENLKKAEKEIRNAWICGIIVCVISTLVAVLMASMSSPSKMMIASPLEIMFGVVIYGGLTLGVMFKNRVCAILLCALFILDKIVMIANGQMSGIILAVVFIYYFALGIQGTFAYHKLKKQNR